MFFPLPFFSIHSTTTEQFSNGITIISLYLNPLPTSDAPPIENSIFQVMKETSLLFTLPENPFFLPGASGSGGHAVQEATYACSFFYIFHLFSERRNSSHLLDCGWIFAQHFCNRLGSAYLQLRNILDETNPTHAEVLNDIKRRFREETFTRESIAQVIHAHPHLVIHFPLNLFFLLLTGPFLQIRLLYVNFAMSHYPSPDDASQLAYVVPCCFFLSFSMSKWFCYSPTLSYQRLQTTQPLTDEELHDKIRRTVPNKHELQVLESFMIFNKYFF